MSNVYVNDFNNTIKSYYEDLKKTSLISKDQERELLYKAKEQNNINARNELITAHLKFVIEVAKKYTGHGIAMEDLIAEGNLGLLKAVEKYDLSKNVRFLSYAAHWVKYYIREIIKKQYQVHQYEDKEILNRQTFNFDIVTQDDINELECNNEDAFSADEEITKLVDSNKMLYNVLDTLSPRGRDILIHYYGLNGEEPMTLDEISAMLHISRERVRQIKVQTLRRLRSHILSHQEIVESFRN